MFRYLVLLVFMLGLGATTALAQSGAEVELVQKKLYRYGAGKADGKMGNKTRVAIRAYQRDWELPETGEITPDLISRLKREHPASRAQWTKVANQDCKTWNTGPDSPVVEVTWTGDCIAGKTSGTGKMVWSYVFFGKGVQSTYEGQLKDGKRHGQGVINWRNANRYGGQWKDGKPHGQGIFIWETRDRYEGQWKDGKPHGQGVSIWASGGRYEGQYKDGKKHGQGIFIWANGGRYEGRYKDGKKHGLGVFSWANDERYEGQYKDGKPHGSGVYITSKGRRENRRWNNGCSKGKMNRAIDRSLKSCGF